jgi:pyruvate dehydrogenase E2 component (dihydrolipoamide acetyltransferase)
MLVGYGPKTTDVKRRPRKQAAADPEREHAHAMMAGTFTTDAPVSRRADHREPLDASQHLPVGNPLPAPGPAAPEPVLSGGAVLAKPPVRKLAKDLGVDLSTLTGSGPGGVITREDVSAAHQKGVEGARARDLSVTSNQAPPPSERFDVRIPIKGIRKATAQAMVQSAFTAPHVSEWLTCDVSATVELLDRLRARREFAEIKISPLLIIARAVCLALRRTPELNSSWDEAAQEIVIKSTINLGIATATPRGLVVPNIRDAGRLGLVELATMINQVVVTAREGRTQPAEMAGGTFTITNIGVFGVDGGTPILNPGEAGILCVGQIARRPWVVGSGSEPNGSASGRGERIEPRWVTTLAISFDHRLADGAQGSTFLADLAGILSDPGLALLY